MPITVISSRAFNQDTSRAKKAAANGPVFITDRGTPAHVLLSFESYQALAAGGQNIVDMLAGEDVPFELPLPNRALARSADLD